MNKASLFLAIYFFFASCNLSTKSSLNIAVAANMQFAIQPIVKEFTNITGIACEIITGSSGKLTAQIKEGAPFDILLSADLQFPNELFRLKKTLDTPFVYAYGKLVLWSMIDGITPSFDLLLHSDIRHIAMANPKTAPFGKSTKELLNQYGIYNQLKDKLVYGESVSQTNQFIISQSVELGFTSKSVVLSKKFKDKGEWIDINPTHYSQPEQSVVVVARKNGNKQNALKFKQFLMSKTTQNILKKFGYSIER